MADRTTTTRTTTESIIMAALSTLTPSQLSTLTTSLSTTLHHHRRRLASLLSSPTLFTHTLNHLYSLSLPQKSLLISRHLLSFLHLLNPFFPPSLSPPLTTSTTFRLRDLDSVLLLLFFCEIRQRHPTSLNTSPAHWRDTLSAHWCNSMLQISSEFAIMSYDVLRLFVDTLVKFRRFVSAKACSSSSSREDYVVKQREVAASVAAVVALPSVEVERGGECAICKEELAAEGRDVCEMPCQHLFHWMCVLRWLRKRNTCPCCRFQLPTDDVYGEIERCWDVIVKLGSPSFSLCGSLNHVV